MVMTAVVGMCMNMVMIMVIVMTMVMVMISMVIAVTHSTDTAQGLENKKITI